MTFQTVIPIARIVSVDVNARHRHRCLPFPESWLGSIIAMWHFPKAYIMTHIHIYIYIFVSVTLSLSLYIYTCILGLHGLSYISVPGSWIWVALSRFSRRDPGSAILDPASRILHPRSWIQDRPFSNIDDMFWNTRGHSYRKWTRKSTYITWGYTEIVWNNINKNQDIWKQDPSWWAIISRTIIVEHARLLHYATWILDCIASMHMGLQQCQCSYMNTRTQALFAWSDTVCNRNVCQLWNMCSRRLNLFQ